MFKGAFTEAMTGGGTQVSLPMLAPLLLGTGMMFRTIRSNASLIFPRVGLLVVLLWVLWFVNSVVQNTVMYLRRQGAIDHRCGPTFWSSPVCASAGPSHGTRALHASSRVRERWERACDEAPAAVMDHSGRSHSGSIAAANHQHDSPCRASVACTRGAGCRAR